MASNARTIPPQSNRFETLAWRYMRWSGVLVLPLVFGHLAIMHIINSVYAIDYEWVIAERWARLGWRIYDAFLLWFAGSHGFNGLRNIVNDYVHTPTLNRAIKVVMLVLLLFLVALGTIALLGAPLRPVELESAFRLAAPPA